MADLPEPLLALIAGLRKLPGVGSRNAERMALAVLRAQDGWPERLADSILKARERIVPCPRCGFHAERDHLCSICSDPARDPSFLCVVETANDVLPIERSKAYQGLFHCLGGKLSPLDGIGPEHLTIAALIERVRKESPSEVILALSTDVEGETTALYLHEHLTSLGVRLSRPAQGLPMGGTLDVTDALTLGRALRDRRTF
jgi:recombination protein RecR